jgi:DNA modification methylase/DNA-binding XRE family transcriptional regulator
MTKNTNETIQGFGKRLASFRKDAGFTQEKLAKKVGVSRRRIAYYEGETQHPPTTILPKLAVALGVSTDALFNVEIEPLDEKSEMSTIRYPEACEEINNFDSCVQEVYRENSVRIIQGDSRQALEDIPDGTFQCCITSPPYWGLRDYGYNGQIGAENDPSDYIEDLVKIFREVRRTLTDDGTLWLNIGDSYTSGNRKWRDTDKKNPARAMSYRPPTPEGLKPKDLIGIPWRLALALQQDGWYLRSDIIWNKPNCQPESVKDRPTRSHEYVFLMSKSKTYYYNAEAIKEPSVNGEKPKNRRTVCNINTNGFHGAHFAVFPPELVEMCLLAGTAPESTVLDPFFGSGTVGAVCIENNRKCVGIELNPEYVGISVDRIKKVHPTLNLYSSGSVEKAHVA